MTFLNPLYNKKVWPKFIRLISNFSNLLKSLKNCAIFKHTFIKTSFKIKINYFSHTQAKAECPWPSAGGQFPENAGGRGILPEQEGGGGSGDGTREWRRTNPDEWHWRRRDNRTRRNRGRRMEIG
jgi:hypothetical protein